MNQLTEEQVAINNLVAIAQEKLNFHLTQAEAIKNTLNTLNKMLNKMLNPKDDGEPKQEAENPLEAIKSDNVDSTNIGVPNE